jgi:drug/metabolite transporter (DMT)-like permease
MTGLTVLPAILLAVSGGVVYHVCAKSVPRDVAPAVVLVAAYATALLLSALALLGPALGGGQASLSRTLHPGILGLGLGAAMIELGYLLAYRAAAPVSATSVVVNGLVAALLIPLGLLVFGERLTAARAAGIVCCLLGVWLLRR